MIFVSFQGSPGPFLPTRSDLRSEAGIDNFLSLLWPRLMPGALVLQLGQEID
jgi:hypothetical protein